MNLNKTYKMLWCLQPFKKLNLTMPTPCNFLLGTEPTWFHCHRNFLRLSTARKKRVQQSDITVPYFYLFMTSIKVYIHNCAKCFSILTAQGVATFQTRWCLSHVRRRLPLVPPKKHYYWYAWGLPKQAFQPHLSRQQWFYGLAGRLYLTQIVPGHGRGARYSNESEVLALHTWHIFRWQCINPVFLQNW